MKWVYGIFIGAITLVSLVWVIQLGLEGKPVSKIKLSEFATTREAAISISLRLRQELKDHSVLFIGVDPQEPDELQIAQEIVKYLIEPGWKFDETFIEKGLELKLPWNLSEKILDIKEFEQEFQTQLLKPENTSRRFVFVVPNIYSSQLIKDNPVQRLIKNGAENKVLSISMVPLADSSDDELLKRIPCVAEGVDFSGQSPLGCVVQKKSMFKRKPLKKGTKQGILEQYGLHDFIFFYRPFMN